MADLFRDSELQLELLGMALYDRLWLTAVGDFVTQDDFRPLSKGQQSMAWILAGIALDFFHKQRVPIGSLISQELGKWFLAANASALRKEEVVKFLRRIKQKYDPSRSNVLQDEVREFKRGKQRLRALHELNQLEQAGQLTDEKMVEILRGSLETFGPERAKDWVGELEQRTDRRGQRNFRRVPALMIDPLDSLIRSIGRGQLGLWLAPYKMGKSLALIWTATSYLFQGHNVLYFTLEDPIADVEDRLDACVTEMLLEDIGVQGPLVQERFNRFKEKLRTGMRLVDGTQGKMTVPQMEATWERERDKGFDADVIIADYDAEIRTGKRQERRQEFSDIYQDYRSFVARKDLYGWTAAQANRKAEGKEVVSGDYAAEDISKIQKVSLAIGIGQGEWGPNSKHLFVAAHKFDQQRIGCTIWSAPEKGMFFDRDKTLSWLAREHHNGNGTNGAR